MAYRRHLNTYYIMICWKYIMCFVPSPFEIINPVENRVKLKRISHTIYPIAVILFL